MWLASGNWHLVHLMRVRGVGHWGSGLSETWDCRPIDITQRLAPGLSSSCNQGMGRQEGGSAMCPWRMSAMGIPEEIAVSMLLRMRGAYACPWRYGCKREWVQAAWRWCCTEWFLSRH